MGPARTKEVKGMERVFLISCSSKTPAMQLPGQMAKYTVGLSATLATHLATMPTTVPMRVEMGETQNTGENSGGVGDLGNVGTVWYSESSLANILSLAMVRKVCRVTMDTAKEAAIMVHQSNGSEMKFLEYESGLYYYGALDKLNSNKTTISAYNMIQTIDENKHLFHQQEVKGADWACELYIKLGRPLHQTFVHLLKQQLINNCPITADYARFMVQTLPVSKEKCANRKVPTYRPSCRHIYQAAYYKTTRKSPSVRTFFMCKNTISTLHIKKNKCLELHL